MTCSGNRESIFFLNWFAAVKYSTAKSECLYPIWLSMRFFSYKSSITCRHVRSQYEICIGCRTNTTGLTKNTYKNCHTIEWVQAYPHSSILSHTIYSTSFILFVLIKHFFFINVFDWLTGDSWSAKLIFLWAERAFGWYWNRNL